jgi:dihydrolipoamide dehydrogenase
VEFAQALNRLGVEITLVLRSDAPLRGEEPEARETLLRVLQHEGVRVVTGVRGFSARDVPGGVELSWIGGSAIAEKLLVATGRGPVTSGLGAEEMGLAMERGYVLYSTDTDFARFAGFIGCGSAIAGI